MCELCSIDPKVVQTAKDKLTTLAEEMRVVASEIDQIIDGSIEPHTPRARQMSVNMKSLVSNLIREF